jgi:hypothetical protein
MEQKTSRIGPLFVRGGIMLTFARRSIYGEAKTAVGISIGVIERGCEADGAERISPPGDGR